MGAGGELEPTWVRSRQPNIFAHLDECDLKLVLSRAHQQRLEAKEILFRQGDLHEGIYLIESGLIRIFYTSPAGREITLAYWEPGNFVGGPEVFGGSMHMWSGMAVSQTEIIFLHGGDLRNLMEKIPRLAIGMVEALVFKGKCFSSLIQMLGTRSVPERLSQLLLTLCEVYGVPEEDGVAIGAHFTHEDLAHMVGASRQWVTTTLDRFQARNIIRIQKRRVVVLRPDLLTRNISSRG